MRKLAIPLFALLSIALAIALVSFVSHEPIPVVGTPVPPEYQPHPHGALASATLLYPTFISPSGKYRVGVDTANVVRLVIPTDAGFSTPDGISTASTLADVRAVSQLPLNADGNFGYTVQLPSGWTARFDSRDGRPGLDAHVASVFARQHNSSDDKAVNWSRR